MDIFELISGSSTEHNIKVIFLALKANFSPSVCFTYSLLPPGLPHNEKH